jgi:uncharacterized membrane protein YjgN (DUF898 family)
MESNLVAGLLAGSVLAVVFFLYMILRGRVLVASLRGLDEKIAGLSDKTIFSVILASFVGAALLFGVLAGIVYSLLGSTIRFDFIAFGAAGLLSFLALVSKTPLTGDKILWNFAVGSVLGIFVPLFSGL